MGPKRFILEYWRLILLLVFVSVALVALFIPGGIMADDSYVDDESIDDNPTNLEYGLGLDGGTRISAPVVGMVAEDIETDATDEEEGSVDRERLTEIESALYEELDLDTGNASVDHDDSGNVHAEVFTDEVTEEEFAAVLSDETGHEVDPDDDVRDGVSDQTRAQMVDTIGSMINEAGLSGGDTYESEQVGGEHYVVTEVPDMDPDELRELLSDRGIVEVVAYYPDDDGQANQTVLEGDDIATVDPPEPSERGSGYDVPVEVDSNAAPDFQEDLNDLGFTDEGQQMCSLEPDGDTVDFDHSDEQYCLLTVVDGEPIDAHSMGPELGNNMNQGEWASDPSFQMGAQNQQQAQGLSVSLQAGAMPAPLDFSEEQTYSLSPALADQFKLYSLLIGGLSVLTVSGMVFLRYRDVRVATPMILTAMAEVVILLGFAALIRMPLDLSHVAGFIAVVGTGVDDLIIIADEVMDEGDVSSQRVFESRFRKAFWIIGAAAATTIIAMSPLAVMSLGDLQGFAIITILGVLIGVLITRPAYGDILQRLMTDK
ncbi:preprotein translocase subunit SecD [Natronorubrum daqingense]|uniref:Protein-export membrane protein SecD n=1 Tax=Natronorubrum daqingense TaxID=588898 RepID=A0A1N6ZT99_9EURY|nr:preprotein translocase subunit SecD [Natronorubrum daqingense]APX95255.1 preprotein translocase subunit SecD [Natronorubrum daqingense]SIR30090.1 preprotein translocase subunit SecD [Natronorubrum daqingense]